MPTKLSATQARISRLLAGRRQSRILVRVKLTGRAGEMWQSLLNKAEALDLLPEDLVTLLLEEGYNRVMTALGDSTQRVR